MRWSDEEKLSIALPYFRCEWRDGGGRVLETIFNVRSQPIASRVDGQTIDPIPPPERVWLLRGTFMPPKGLPPTEYYYGPRSPANGDPFGYRRAGAAARERCREVLRQWGIDPDERMREAAREWRWERRVQRWEDKAYGGAEG
jgi:hypothetical protein